MLREESLLVPEARDVTAVVVDLSELAFCDPTGARALVSFRDAHAAARRAVTVVAARRNVLSTLRALGVEQVVSAH